MPFIKFGNDYCLYARHDTKRSDIEVLVKYGKHQAEDFVYGSKHSSIGVKNSGSELAKINGGRQILNDNDFIGTNNPNGIDRVYCSISFLSYKTEFKKGDIIAVFVVAQSDIEKYHVSGFFKTDFDKSLRIARGKFDQSIEMLIAKEEKELEQSVRQAKRDSEKRQAEEIRKIREAAEKVAKDNFDQSEKIRKEREAMEAEKLASELRIKENAARIKAQAEAKKEVMECETREMEKRLAMQKAATEEEAKLLAEILAMRERMAALDKAEMESAIDPLVEILKQTMGGAKK